ncbi:PLP-dependent aminotransferase family protein [Paenibacillus sp. HWE-109]|uniref:MocR-like pyridoxine biosynthesis transcription factor PdxR n=1 Tax=Paenibacillus sp. HWE-109 TaxID=1306526 RepID=UPI001EDD689B|nr:PLP-dependent aminotransferase family protein [Paenibacillus sp. HWE-109]UKS27084.1 PLP-dependent aminotransferase family protein [Paenibacillus sp. HWE-109]
MIWIHIDRNSGIPMYRQIYDHFRRKILQGEMHSGERLPSTRDLAASLRVSRNIVVEAYEQLLAEGYIEGRHGSGTFVSEGTYLEGLADERFPADDRRSDSSRYETELIDFRPGLPALNLFPRKLWGQLAEYTYNNGPDTAFGYGKPEGREELRSVLMRYLRRTRGVICEQEQLVITTGATQALSLIAKLLLADGSDAVIEDPITYEIQTMFSMPGTTLYPVPVDHQGMQTQLLPLDIQPSLVYVTPSHQYPLGGVLPIQRRVQLIQYARSTGCYIVEDDYDSEFRYESAPVSSLQGLDPDRVIYIGTFSKILSPALRMGYLILPQSLIARGRNLKRLTDLHTPSMEQLTLARFIDEGHLDRHIAKMKKIYRKRRDFLIATLMESFADRITIRGHSTGLHLVVEFTDVIFTSSLLDAIEQNGVKIYPVEIHAMNKGKQNHRIILGYGNLSEAEVAKGIQRLAAALSQAARTSSTT